MKASRVAAALVSAALALGCRSSTEVSVSIVGTYTLQSVSGLALPVVLADDEEGRLELVSGSVVLNADMSFTDATTLRNTLGEDVTTETEVATGTYSRSGSTVTFQPTEGGNYSMTWDGENTLTQNFLGLILVYVR